MIPLALRRIWFFGNLGLGICLREGKRLPGLGGKERIEGLEARCGIGKEWRKGRDHRTSLK